jgi:protein-S-isoprenylcysteine O-methyltransferase Ste14
MVPIIVTVRTFAWIGAALFVASLSCFGWQYFVTLGTPAPRDASATAAWLVNAALFTAFALHHSILARPGAKALVTRAVSPHLERSLYVWIASLLFLAVMLGWRLVPGQVWRVTGPLAWLFYTAALAGVAITLRAAATFDVFELSGVRQASGESPAASTEVIRDGIYGVVRHPIYLGWVLLVWGMPDMTMTRFSFAVISTAYLLIAIPFEERSLRESMGPAYAEYSRDVRWRVIPGVY